MRRAGVACAGRIAAALVVLGLARPLAAQESLLTDQCATLTTDDARRFCNLVGQAVFAALPPVGLAATGGNPVPGTASTLGMRIGSTPRITVGARLTVARVETPRILDRVASATPSYLLPGLGMDVAVSVFNGISPAPTVGGLLSLDAVGHVGLVPAPSDGFGGGLLVSRGVGLRLGLLRESFTLPGVSVSAMYHVIGDVTYGDPRLLTSDGFFRSSASILSLRAAVSKRIMLLGVTAGVGFDRSMSDTRIGLDTGGGTATFAVTGLDVDRVSAFLNAEWTMLVVHLVGEVGWQAGSGEFPALLPSGGGVEGGSIFGGLAVRLTI